MDAVGAPDTAATARTPATAQRWRRAFVVSLVVMVLLVIVLVATGLSLLGSYWPTAPGAEVPLDQGLHQVAATLLQAVALLAGVCALGWFHATARADGRWVWIAAAGVLALVLAASVTGDRLPFDGLALWAVAPGRSVDGVWFAAFDPSVRFVYVGEELGQVAYQRRVLLHLASGAAVVLGVVAIGVTQARSRSDG